MTTMEIELPSGMQGPDGEWTKKVVLEHMTGDEEDIIADASRVGAGKGHLKRSGGDKVTEILSRCTVSVGAVERTEKTDRYTAPLLFKAAWHDAYIMDRVFAIIRLRQLSLGNVYRFGSKCPYCSHEDPSKVLDLGSLEVTTVPLDEAKKATRSFALPSKSDVLEWRSFTGKDEEPIALISRNHPDQFLSMILARRIVSTAKGVKERLEFMKRMSASDRRAFGDECDKVEGGIDMTVTHECANKIDCGKEYSEKLEVMGKSFFFPSDVPEASSSTSPSSPSGGNGPDKTSTDYLCGNESVTADG